MKPKLPKFWTIIILLLLLTYGRWEFLTWLKGKEFAEAVASNAPICYLYEGDFDIDYIKVTSLSWNRAQVFMKAKNGNTFLISFRKMNGEWRVFYDDVCNYDIINSAIGGSADSWYWYW